MPFNNLITRGDAVELIPEPVVQGLFEALRHDSAALALCQRMVMSSATARMPVLSSLPKAYWVAGDTGLKQTTSAVWDKVHISAEEIAAIVPIPDAVISDAEIDIWRALEGPIATEFARVLDLAILSGVDRPSEAWPDGIIEAATAAGNVVEVGSAPEAGGIMNDLDQLIDVVEESGHEVTAFVADRRLRSLLRRARSTSGEPLVEADLEQARGVRFTWAIPGSLQPEGVLCVAGDFDAAVVGVRQDVTYQMFSEGVITDETGKVVLNLMQQDSVAARVVGRWGYARGNPPSLLDGRDAVPFAVLTAGDGETRARTPSKK